VTAPSKEHRMADDNDRDDDPSLAQRLHAATGDREAEAEALADRAEDDDVDLDAAKVAVNRAHGHAPEDVDADGALASTEDAARAADDLDG
jgi:hypothetical protein